MNDDINLYEKHGFTNLELNKMRILETLELYFSNSNIYTKLDETILFKEFNNEKDYKILYIACTKKLGSDNLYVGSFHNYQKVSHFYDNYPGLEFRKKFQYYR